MKLALALCLLATTALADPTPHTGDTTPTPQRTLPEGSHATPNQLSAAFAELLGDWNANTVLQNHIAADLQSLQAQIHALPVTPPAPAPTTTP